MASAVSQGPCPHCSSSDAYTLYDDGHNHCFSCGKQDGNGGRSGGAALPELVFKALRKRHLTEETCRKFRYGYHDGKQAATYYDAAGHPVALKCRTASKNFSWIGKSKQAVLFGQNLWRQSDRIRVVVTEGEIDALSVSQVQGNKWPVVSLRNGAASAKRDLAVQLEWLEGFKQVVLMFDSDDPGRLAAEQCAELFTPGKCSIAHLPLKDANEMLVAGRVKELKDFVWNAKPYRPDGLLSGSQALERVLERKEADGDPYPWAGLTSLTRGMHGGTIITLCGGTGIGKSEILREIAHWIIKQGRGFGYVALEESVRRTAQGVLSIELEKPLHLLESAISPEEIRAASESLGFERSDVVFFDHFGSLDADALISKFRFMAKAEGIRYAVLDHVSIVVSGQRNENERQAIDNLMTDLRSMVQETGMTLFVVSHLKRPVDGKPFEEGRKPRLSDLRGSSALESLSDFVFGLSRNKRAEGDARNLMTVEVLKNRHSGEEGDACVLRYELETSRLREGATEGFEDDGSSDF